VALAFRLKILVKSEFFNNLIMAMIVLNTMVMATEHYGQPSWLDQAQDLLNYVFAGVFLLEMVMKIGGLGLKEYIRCRLTPIQPRFTPFRD